MLSSAMRVLVRSAAIQLEEAALASRSLPKGKERAIGERQIPVPLTNQTAREEPGTSRSQYATTERLDPVQEESTSSVRLPEGVRKPRTVERTFDHGIGSELSNSAHVNTTPSAPEQNGNLGGRKLPEEVITPRTTPTHELSTHLDHRTSADGDPTPDYATLLRTTLTPGDSQPNVLEDMRPAGAMPQTAQLPPTSGFSASASISRTDKTVHTLTEEEDEPAVLLRASKVPSSRIGRLFHYGSLAASLSFGAASESIRRSTGGEAGQGSVFMSDANVRRLVAALGRMRGAALKLGQFMSIQDNHLLAPEIEKVLHQVQAHANYMPEWQMEKVMSTEFGSEWHSIFSSFDRVPFASASIGQVHRGVLASSDTAVAVKVQFPGIASSINSDLANLSLLFRSSALLPKGLYLQNTIAVMRRELEDECDYIREGDAGKRFEGFLRNDEFFVVPKVVDAATTGKVLTTEWMSGKPLSRIKGMSQETRDRIGTNILRLCLQELFQFRFMQTDPNWANFLYDAPNDQLQLIDFGASREYTKTFMDGWYRLLTAALRGDRQAMKEESEKLGYLTGDENAEMLNAHLDSMAIVASPFSHRGPYAFANQTITDSVRSLIPIMLQHRLTPPPPETYSLNRKLSGAFLMCARLGANVDCQRLWEDYVGDYRQG